MAYDHPVQNSEVYLLNSAPHACLPASAPPSPPTPSTSCDELPPPLDDLMSLTPPKIEKGCPPFNQRLTRAVHVLSTEATSLSSLTMLYDTDPVARDGFSHAVEAIKKSIGERGKLVICGVGKSGHIAQKLVATMRSLKIPAIFIHATEAVHGDVGAIGKYDTILLITFSGKTKELLDLLPHLDPSLPMIVLTGHRHRSSCEIINLRPKTILLPAPIHESETLSFGCSAPTTSTTMAIAVGDALALATARELHSDIAAVFSKNHPGGAIGAAFKATQTVSDIAVCLADMPDLGNGPNTGADVLIKAYGSESGWVRCGTDTVIPPSCIKQLGKSDMNLPATSINGLMISKKNWVTIPADTEVSAAKELYGNFSSETGFTHSDDTILAIMDDLELIGVLHIGDLV
ncbi:57ea342b-3dde-44dd-8491-5dd4d5dcbbd7-CDS [Sclerotinia trifoliorum]|uniref:57ea342b-3dde-44dd-8491-5dd4d5dcbbd7-CDS n=1 Tax=Sclerotinia trifoliorum TaxID=28548 RepID=A0A8H2VUL1_9HELO|nr:57ea342b-3dde-44dd-8491-5dd4d5dcbbd7-CDS [Sclerotinia trifoliorum]